MAYLRSLAGADVHELWGCIALIFRQNIAVCNGQLGSRNPWPSKFTSLHIKELLMPNFFSECIADLIAVRNSRFVIAVLGIARSVILGMGS